MQLLTLLTSCAVLFAKLDAKPFDGDLEEERGLEDVRYMEGISKILLKDDCATRKEVELKIKEFSPCVRKSVEEQHEGHEHDEDDVDYCHFREELSSCMTTVVKAMTPCLYPVYLTIVEKLVNVTEATFDWMCELQDTPMIVLSTFVEARLCLEDNLENFKECAKQTGTSLDDDVTLKDSKFCRVIPKVLPCIKPHLEKCKNKLVMHLIETADEEDCDVDR